ncbi:hypothetical protein [Allobranchiibius sp. GilTou73]|uniref:hypothetical protein n=1 Tax=Allobranchiibius sp. GilTou73 TaxID=2904523 RepID=UPI001F264C6C|nr:hypothetical protein [Allobranchiibius sp. GilTou73]UIJ34738.1 hypothetical protein LVQ62_16840 [Allobranchiibius sp. GilTou73]
MSDIEEPTTEDPTADTQQPVAEEPGTAGGDPLAGVRISEEDAKDAVPGDTGPELPGEPGNNAGHA